MFGFINNTHYNIYTEFIRINTTYDSILYSPIYITNDLVAGLISFMF